MVSATGSNIVKGRTIKQDDKPPSKKYVNPADVAYSESLNIVANIYSRVSGLVTLLSEQVRDSFPSYGSLPVSSK